MVNIVFLENPYSFLKKVYFCLKKRKDITTLTLEFQLEESLAYAYREAQAEEKEDIKKLFERLLSAKFRKQAIANMFKNMESIGKEAEANGLTEDLINEILKES